MLRELLFEVGEGVCGRPGGGEGEALGPGVLGGDGGLGMLAGGFGFVAVGGFQCRQDRPAFGFPS